MSGTESVRLNLKRRKPRWMEELIRWLLFISALISVATTVAIILILLKETYVFFTMPLESGAGTDTHVSALEFLTGTRWTPLIAPQHFGVLPLVMGTIVVTFGSAIVAIPLGLLTAFYLSEYASHKTRSIIKPILEILAGIPSVVYGYFALTFITPIMKVLLDPILLRLSPDSGGVQVFNAASAAIVVGIMVLPMVASLCDDAFQAVPDSLRQGGYAMGATKFEVSTQVLLPAALSGVLASFIVALSRAIGETMAVVLAAGANPTMSMNPFEPVQTMTAYIVNVSLGDTPAFSVEYQTIFAVGALLFAITLFLNYVAHKVVLRFREVYE